uniref:Dirigent protein n=1 Tax=Panax notoginseng TaxID=44586 RepID=A0A411DVD8_9APIA|nr:dirigent family protein [Panax notoginseng]
MGKLCLISLVVFLSIVISMRVVHGIDESPEAVENWFKTLGNKKQKVTKLHFFLHQTGSTGLNPTAYPVANSDISSTSPTLFGLVSIIDNPMKVGPESNSTIVGRAQGLTATSSLEEISLLMTMNFLFTNGKYNGSTLSVHGRNPLTNRYREMAVVGGSGVFRLATGIATAQTISLNATSDDIVTQYHVVVIHYAGNYVELKQKQMQGQGRIQLLASMWLNFKKIFQ